MSLIKAAAGIAVLLAAMLPRAGAAEATLLDETGSGVVPVNTETTVRVNAVQGQVALQRGNAGEVEFRSVSLDNAEEEIPIALSTDGEAFRLEPPQGRPSRKVRLTVSIPPGTKVRLDVENVAVSIVNLDSELTVSGRQVQVEGQGLLRPARFEIEGGQVKVFVAAKGVTVRGRDLAVVLENVSGRAEVKLSGGTARLNGMLSGLQGDFTGTRVVIDSVTDAASLRFVSGSASVARLRDGGDITLTGCELKLEQPESTLSIASDSAIQFSGGTGNLHIENSAGMVRGVTFDGVLDIKTHNAQVAVGQAKGELRISGDILDVQLGQVSANVNVVTRSSTVTVDLATGPVSVENEGGPVIVKHADAKVDVKCRGGSVQLVKLRGPASVEADVELVEVEWEVLTSAADSKIVNEGGGVTVVFPPSGDCRVDATSRNGRVESSLPKVVAADDRGSAKGVVNGEGQELKTVTIKAEGDINLKGLDVVDAPGQAP